MSDQYIWDKTGSDPEIEGLEELLGSMRYVPAPAPELPARTAGRTWWSFWKISIGVAVPAAAMVIIVGLFWTPPGTTDIVQDNRTPTAQTVAAADPAPADKTVDDKQPRPQHPTLTKPVFRTKAKQRHIDRPLLARTVRDRRSAPVLTREEKFAYDQVKLALSISATQLKVVKDSVNNTDEE